MKNGMEWNGMHMCMNDVRGGYLAKAEGTSGNLLSSSFIHYQAAPPTIFYMFWLFTTGNTNESDLA